MRIEMITTAASERGVFHAGSTYEVPAALGQEFLDAGAAIDSAADGEAPAPRKRSGSKKSKTNASPDSAGVPADAVDEPATREG